MPSSIFLCLVLFSCLLVTGSAIRPREQVQILTRAPSRPEDIPVPAHDPRFTYNGRWQAQQMGKYTYQRADWPCSQVRFGIDVAASAVNTTVSVSLYWYGDRSRVNVSVVTSDGTLVHAQEFQGPEMSDPLAPEPFITTSILGFIPSSPGLLTVSFTKLTTADPFGAGIGIDLLQSSILNFFGTSDPSNSNANINSGGGGDGVTIVAAPGRSRYIEAVGASDTAGYCVDGTTKNSGIILKLNGWRYVNCDFAYPARLGRAFNADVSVQAISGIGLIQNAAAHQKWQMGPYAMPIYFERTLVSVKDAPWNFTTQSRQPDLVMISLGGDDYNHQNGSVPSNTTFSAAYTKFLYHLFTVYPSSTTQFAAVCGMGSPNEVKFDPDNNRCRPCPHVEAGVQLFQSTYLQYANRTHYLFIPCDGSVVTGTGDIGCDGHKNRIGQAEVASFLQPRLATIMGW